MNSPLTTIISMPDFVRRIVGTPAMQRLGDVGMNCGCEYTSFPLFQDLERYSRLDHSIGVGLIVWHFTHDVQQTVAALLHDIATPTFAHVVDFMNGDHVRQESTERGTTETIASSCELQACLASLGLATADVDDYHRFPIADNDTPRLSADRLEYTLGNIVNYHIASQDDVCRWFSDLVVDENEDGIEELMFAHLSVAEAFGLASLRTSAIYVADEDRYAMQMLAQLMRKHIDRGILTLDDLYTTETQVVRLLTADDEARADWLRFRALHTMQPTGQAYSAPLAIPAKKRHINPYVRGLGRLSSLSASFENTLRQFLTQTFEHEVCGA